MNAPLPLDVFRVRCEARATLVREGALDFIQAVDELQNAAAAYGIDADIGQRIMTEAFAAAPAEEFDSSYFWQSCQKADEKHSKPNGGAPEQDANGRGVGRFRRQTSAQFVADFVPPDYVVDGVIQRRFLYSFTGRTGSGKTAVVLLIAASVALERKIGDLEVAPGTVFYFCGENPDDVRMRWIALAQQMDFDPATIAVHFFPGVFQISEMREKIIAEAQLVGGVVLIIVDTSAAYFEGDEPNNNAQQGRHARMLRTLTELPGGPCVLVNCHPVKNAAPDNLIPYGGGAFINEVDGNLTCAIDNLAIEVSWQGKFRGPDFQPLAFKVRTVTHERLKDTRGRLVPTVIAEHLSEAAQQDIAKVARSHEDQLLAEVERDGRGSQADYACRCGWMMQNGQPYKVLVRRTLKTLQSQKLIAPDRDGFALTDKGKKSLKKAGTFGTNLVPVVAQPEVRNTNRNRSEQESSDPMQPVETSPEQGCSDFGTEQAQTHLGDPERNTPHSRGVRSVPGGRSPKPEVESLSHAEDEA